MITDEKGRHLHDKASQGEKLTTEEQTQLEEWYACQDQLETASLGLHEQEKIQASLQFQIEEVLAQLVKVSTRIQQIVLENEMLRRENTSLRQQAAHLFGSPSA